jgi:hypothetical protein
VEVKNIADVEAKDADVCTETEDAGLETENAISDGMETDCIGTEDVGVENAAGGDTVTELLCAGVTSGNDEARTEDGGAE